MLFHICEVPHAISYLYDSNSAIGSALTPLRRKGCNHALSTKPIPFTNPIAHQPRVVEASERPPLDDNP
jgi:hypothetical protein